MSPAPDAQSLDDVLRTIRQAFADIGTVMGIMADLRAQSDRMRPLLANELRELRPHIDRAIVLLTDQ